MRVFSLIVATVAVMSPVASSIAQGGPTETSAPVTGAAVVTAGQPVIIKHGSTTLKGTVETPADTEKHAGIVIVYPGDEKASELAKQLAKVFAQRGIIALTYEATEPSAAEAQSAVQTLKLRGDLKRDEVGIIGIGSAAKMAADVAKSENLRYAIAVAPTTETSIDPVRMAKVPQKVLVVRGVEDPFSSQTERYRQSAEKKSRNLTLWVTPDSDIVALNTADSPLLSRIIGWATARNG